MRKVIIFAIVVALVGAAAVMAEQPRRQRVDNPPANAAQPPAADRALVWLDYWNAGGSHFTWGGNMYMSNLFKPTAGTWPLDVVALEVYTRTLDGSTVTAAAGTLNGVAVFDPAGAVLSRQLNIAVTNRTWTQVPLVTQPTITTGNFYAGLWNDAVAGDRGWQCTALGWTTPPDEPFACITAGTAGTANGAGPWTVGACGSGYSTVSAASIRAQVNTNVPVELMSFDVQ